METAVFWLPLLSAAFAGLPAGENFGGKVQSLALDQLKSQLHSLSLEIL